MSFAGSESMSNNPPAAVVDHQENDSCSSVKEDQELSRYSTSLALNPLENWILNVV
jgi:hypothetical protein